LSASFVGWVLADIAGFGSASAMVETMQEYQLRRWKAIPEDGEWHFFQQPAQLPTNSFNKPESYPHVMSGHKHWKGCMGPNAHSFMELMNALSVYPVCTLCCNCTGDFDAHVLAHKHYCVVYQHVLANDQFKETLWHKTCFVGGQVKYNLLDGEIYVLRVVPVPVEEVINPQHLSKRGDWILVGAPVVVPAQTNGIVIDWPNLWSPSQWRLKMTPPVDRVVHRLEVDHVDNFRGSWCMICNFESFDSTHLLGPKHFGRLKELLPAHQPVVTDKFWQTWCSNDGKFSMAFNHVDGSLKLIDTSGEVTIPPSIMLPPPVGSEVPFADVLAAGSRRPVQAPPSPDAHMGEVIASSQAATTRGANMVLAPQQQQNTFVPTTWSKVSPWCTQAPLKHATLATPHSIGTQQPPVSDSCPFLWCWQLHADCNVKPLEEVLVARLGSNVALSCVLCQATMLSPNRFAQHVGRDLGHIAKVRACFNFEGPTWKGWVQCWDGVAQLNHLSLKVDITELSASGGRSEVTTATCSGTAQISTCEGSPVKKLCAAVQSGTIAIGDQEEPLWAVYIDDISGRQWYYNRVTGKSTWSKPEDMDRSGPNVSPEDIHGDGGQQHASSAATLSADTGGQATTDSFCC
jgi:hypothetical protein